MKSITTIFLATINLSTSYGKIKILNGTVVILDRYSKNAGIGDKKLLSELKDINQQVKSNAFEKIIKRDLTKEEKEFLDNPSLTAYLENFVGLYFRLEGEYPEISEKAVLSINKLLEFRDSKRFNQWLFKEAEWNKEVYAELLKSGYNPLLLDEGIRKTLPVEGKGEDIFDWEENKIEKLIASLATRSPPKRGISKEEKDILRAKLLEIKNRESPAPASSSIKQEEQPLCLTPDSLITLANGSQKPLIALSATKRGGSAFGGKPQSTYAVNKAKEEDGDMVLSLNEETGRLEPHRVLALLDMGVKPVYRLTTASGKQLKTTLTHPYLTKKGWRKLQDIKVGEEITVIKEAVNYSRQSRDPDTASGQPLTINSGVGEGVKEINGHVLSLGYSCGQERLKLAQKPKIQKPLTELTSLISSFLLGLNKDTTAKEYQTRNCQEDFQYRRESFKEIARQANSENRFSQIRNYLGNKFSTILGYSLHQDKIYHLVKGLSRLFSIPNVEAGQIWESVSNSDILWDKIISIEPLGLMPVYDIEVEATHNFIAQGIVAHNTYTNANGKSLIANRKEETAGSALENKGGIDLNPQNLEMEIRGEGISSSPFTPLETIGQPENVKRSLTGFTNISLDLQDFQGFSFQIISIQPVKEGEAVFS